MQHFKKITPEKESEILQMHSQGHAASAIAEKLGVHRNTVYHALWRAGLTKEKPGKKPYCSAGQVEQMKNFYAKGFTYGQIAEVMKLSQKTVMRYLQRAGVQSRPAGFQKGEAHHAWNGGVTVNSSGYVMERVYPDDPFFCMAVEKADGASYAAQHRLVMARYLGRPLEDHETVHHVDGNKANNSLKNLQLRSGRHGKGVILQCADCGSHNINSRPLS